MSKQNQKRRRRATLRKHEAQRCHGCALPGATESATVKNGIGTKKPSKAKVFFHRKCLAGSGAVA